MSRREIKRERKRERGDRGTERSLFFSDNGCACSFPVVLYFCLGGRMASAIYEHMNLVDVISSSHAEYIDIAVRLGLDLEFNKKIREEIKEKSKLFKVFEDELAIQHLSNWILNTANNTLNKKK